MRLAALEVVPYALRFRRPYVTARGELARREMALLRLRDGEGRVGHGEAVPLSLRGGTTITAVVRELESLGSGELDSDAVAANAAALSAPARCAVVTALDDLIRQAEGNPSGSEAPRFARCNATLVSGEPAAVAADAERWAAAGFSTFKLKLGAGDDVGQVQAVREVIDPIARIRVDANGSWSVEEAKRILGAIEPFDVELVEQPVATLEEMAQLNADTPIPIAADESVASRAEAERARELGACTIVGVKLSKVGGWREAQAIAEVMPTYLSSALDGPVGIAAAVELASQSEVHKPFDEPLAHGLATQRLFCETIAAVECQLFDDMLQMPRGPGLGVKIDEDALQAHRL
ncbi:MAG TPA: mandelate racemase/muconate lactonizing enzyme family protein [Solirubrobacterales bacterium]|jgi:O-succinylbenzoate synthase|nr:mandelate racemase/muconate lactonizing enzyme family protein [Solirubrobacterales bacterium]